ncbi:hypothetical protein BDR06DRAFT_392377 [Suillus hirtellus]|nr:hypothetical protein BDR06DRAFT_392377 [Suillus hirtellus]
MFCNMVKKTYILRKIPSLPVPFLIGLLLSSFAGGPLNFLCHSSWSARSSGYSEKSIQIPSRSDIREALTYENDSFLMIRNMEGKNQTWIRHGELSHYSGNPVKTTEPLLDCCLCSCRWRSLVIGCGRIMSAANGNSPVFFATSRLQTSASHSSTARIISGPDPDPHEKLPQ